MESFRDAASASAHPVAAALFEIPGVVDVFMVPTFLTVTKDPAADWEAVWPAVAASLDVSIPG